MKRFCCLWVIGCLWFPLMGWAAPAPPGACRAIVARAAAMAGAAQRIARRPGACRRPTRPYDRRLQRLSGANVELMKLAGQNPRRGTELAQLSGSRAVGNRFARGRDRHRSGPQPDPERAASLAVFRPVHARAATGGQRPEKQRRGRSGKARQPDPRRRAYAERHRRLPAQQLSALEFARCAVGASGLAAAVESAGRPTRWSTKRSWGVCRWSRSLPNWWWSAISACRSCCVWPRAASGRSWPALSRAPCARYRPRTWNNCTTNGCSRSTRG